MSQPLTATEMTRRRAVHTGHFPHVCDVWRAGAGTTDAYGEPIPGAPAVLHDELRCHLVNRETGGERVTPERVTVTRQWELRVPAGTDIRASDDVRDVRDQFGDVIAAGPLDLNEIITHPSVTICIVERVN